MTKTVEIDIAQANLEQLIAGLGPNDEVVIVRDRKPVAKLVPSPLTRLPRQPGLFKHMINVLAEDDEHLQDFEDYMP